MGEDFLLLSSAKFELSSASCNAHGSVGDAGSQTLKTSTANLEAVQTNVDRFTPRLRHGLDH